MSKNRIVAQAVETIASLRITRVYSRWNDGSVDAYDVHWRDDGDLIGPAYTPESIPSGLRWVETAPILAAVASKP